MKKIKENIEIKMATDLVTEALIKLKIARDNYNSAESDFIDIAIAELEIAEKTLDIAIKRVKMLS